MPEQTTQQDGTKVGFAHVTMPNAFVTPYTYTAKDGRTFEKAYVHFAQGTKVNGIDIGGFSCDVFLNDRMKQQLLSDEPVTLSFKEDEMVSIWKGRKDDPENPYQRFEVNPWALVKGVKAEFEDFKADKPTATPPMPSRATTCRTTACPRPDRGTLSEGRGTFQEPSLRGV